MNQQRLSEARERLKNVAVHTPLLKNENLSTEFGATVWLKREDLQPVRSYKLRGAFNKMASLDVEQRRRGVVCASAGNHAQGVAYSAHKLGVTARIYMPVTTPQQKIKQVHSFGKENVEIMLLGDTFDDAYNEAINYSNENERAFIHPFDDDDVIAGQGTIGLELMEDIPLQPDYIFVPIGGGGLAAGICLSLEKWIGKTRIIGVEPGGAASMKLSLERGTNTALENINTFVDGASVKRVGDKTFEVCKRYLHSVIPVPEGKVCTTILRLYNEDALVVEPAGALSIAALDSFRNEISGKNVVCIVSGSNNDIVRTEEIKERSLLYEGLKHYFIVNFPQRPGALKEFVTKVLGPGDDITYFQFSKKNNRENGPAVVGIELENVLDKEGLFSRMKSHNIRFHYLNEDAALFTQLVG